MASAGRILIMPKGAYDATTTYEMLDLVSHNSASWLAKKTSVGIEPSDANSEYWHNLIDLDLTADEVGAIARNGYGYFYGNVDELREAGTYVVISTADNMSGSFPLSEDAWYTVNVTAGGTGSNTQTWVYNGGETTRVFVRHFNAETWSAYFELLNANKGLFTSDVTIQKADNGNAIISKNHSAEADYGTFIKDVLADGTSAKLTISASAGESDALGFSFNDGGYKRLYGEHNTDTLIAMLSNAGFGGSTSSTSGLQIATGNYVGAGVFGESNKNSLTFGFEPKIVLITTGTTFSGACVWHYGASMISMQVVGTTSSQNIFFEQSGNTLSWYNASQASYQLNDASMTYAWVAIG